MNNPYAKLGGGALDQELFKKKPQQEEASAQTPMVTPAKETKNSGNPGIRESGQSELRESGKPAFRDSGSPSLRQAGKPELREHDGQPATNDTVLFNINESPTIKETFLITDSEYDSMEDMKIRIRRLFDMKASKQDIIRCAMQHILKNFHKRPEASIIVSRLKQKKK